MSMLSKTLSRTKICRLICNNMCEGSQYEIEKEIGQKQKKNRDMCVLSHIPFGGILHEDSTSIVGEREKERASIVMRSSQRTRNHLAFRPCFISRSFLSR